MTSRALLGSECRRPRRRCGLDTLGDGSSVFVPFSRPLGVSFGRPFRPLSWAISSVNSATLPSSVATAPSRSIHQTPQLRGAQVIQIRVDGRLRHAPIDSRSDHFGNPALIVSLPLQTVFEYSQIHQPQFCRIAVMTQSMLMPVND